ncbi:MAG: TRAP transporter small permease [Castellaniella sp.]|uniref:TRAP transporter small permease subunit n=1 Tax=Castellaniella sp. TaxID=1955812 RepID=UPI003C72B7DA
MNPSDRYPVLDGLLRRANTLSRAAIWVAGGLTLASALYITLDVLVRYFVGRPLGGADELSGYAFAISISWALSFATLQRANIRIDALYQYLPPRIGALFDWLALVVLGVFIVYWTRYAATVAGLSWDNQSAANTTFATPLWIPQSLWVAGLIWLCVVLALMLLRSTMALVTGDLRTVRDICGVRSTKEEADAEAEAGKRLVEGDAS